MTGPSLPREKPYLCPHGVAVGPIQGDAALRVRCCPECQAEPVPGRAGVSGPWR